MGIFFFPQEYSHLNGMARNAAVLGVLREENTENDMKDFSS